MSTISAQSRDHLRQTIIDEIKSLEVSTRALKSRRNDLAPISCLPPETLATIFAFMSASAWNEGAVDLEWMCVAHVCRRWRETALNYPRFWSHINLTKLTSTGTAEILARAKMAPLSLEADVSVWWPTRLQAFGTLLEAHISHTRHLSISGYLESVIERLLSSAPTLESLSLTHKTGSVTIPDNFFNCTTPNLTSLELKNCSITSWKSPVLKGLQNLQVLNIFTQTRHELEDWLEALNDMSNLKTLSLQSAIRLAPLANLNSCIPKPSHTIALPSLTHFHINASARDSGFLLAHLVFPTLTWLHIEVESHNREGEDVLLLIPYVARNVHVVQDIDPIRSILIAGERLCTEVLAWAMTDVDADVSDSGTLGNVSHSACLRMSANGINWRSGVDTVILDALLAHLPVNSVSTFTAQNRTRLSKGFWLRHASRWPLLEQARLVPTSVRAFRDMLAEDTPPDGPRLPLLTRLVLLGVKLTAIRTCHLRDMLIRRVEQGVPLEVLDLRTCVAVDHAIRSFAEIVVDVQEPLARPMAMEEFFKDVDGDLDKVEYDDGGRPWYGDMSNGEDEDEDVDEDEDDMEHDDEFDYDYEDIDIEDIDVDEDDINYYF